VASDDEQRRRRRVEVKVGARERGESKMGRGLLPCAVHAQISLPMWISDDWHRCPLYREQNHGLVTDSVAGGSGTRYRLPRLKPVLGH
jgi:hypothetical protein